MFLVVNHCVGRNVERAGVALPVETKHKGMRELGSFAGYGNGVGTTRSQSAESLCESIPRAQHEKLRQEVVA